VAGVPTGGHLGVNSFLNEVESGFMSDSEIGATGALAMTRPAHTSHHHWIEHSIIGPRQAERRAVYGHSFLARSCRYRSCALLVHCGFKFNSVLISVVM